LITQILERLREKITKSKRPDSQKYQKANRLFDQISEQLERFNGQFKSQKNKYKKLKQTFRLNE
jgi:hypothetical protein